MEIAEHIAALRQHGESLAAAADRAGLGAPVPACAPWLVKDLLRHTGYVHRWAARHITECPERVLDGPPEAEILDGGAPDDELLAWFRAGHAALVETLTAADPDLRTATFMDAASPLAFWARRQAHETAIHRADADSAAGAMAEFTPDFAADGIDELIMGFGRRSKYQPHGHHQGTLRFAATDTGDDWYAQAEDGLIQPRRGDGHDGHAGPATCTVSGPASGLYLFLWNRAEVARAGVTISGDPGLFSQWKSSVRVRWG
ncbi:MAG TPA: maleylpyruvate isomerase family mycothiol-dependent enzyme [Streptosporangiaceae bacterium]